MTKQPTPAPLQWRGTLQMRPVKSSPPGRGRGGLVPNLRDIFTKFAVVESNGMSQFRSAAAGQGAGSGSPRLGGRVGDALPLQCAESVQMVSQQAWQNRSLVRFCVRAVRKKRTSTPCPTTCPINHQYVSNSISRFPVVVSSQRSPRLTIRRRQWCF